MRYWVCISKYVPLKEYRQTVWSGFVESVRSIEEVKESILEHHKKKGLTGLHVTVLEGPKDGS